MYFVEIYFVNVFTNYFYQFTVAFKFYILDIDFFYFFNDSSIMRRKHLCTVIPISLITVIFTWIMTGCNVYTALTFKIANCKTHFRSRAHIVKQINFNTVSREYIGRCFSKQTAVVSAIMTDDNGYLFHILEVLVKIIGKTLSSSTDSIYVHTVSSSTHNST